jgi:hypothetical protein
MTELQTRPNADAMESLIIKGDLSGLTPAQRVTYYNAVCKSLGLNPLTKPFDYLNLNGKLVLYANKTASDQLRNINAISIEKPDITFEDDWIIVTVGAHDGKGRSDSDVGVVSKKDMRGDFGNALMKAVTKAKRRVTLSICGLGWADETEVETIPGAKTVTVDATTGEIKPEAPQIEASSQPEPATISTWTTDTNALKGFWANWHGKGLTDDEVHLNLEVLHLKDYRGSMSDAAKILQAVLDKKAAAKKT